MLIVVIRWIKYREFPERGRRRGRRERGRRSRSCTCSTVAMHPVILGEQMNRGRPTRGGGGTPYRSGDDSTAPIYFFIYLTFLLANIMMS
jgi:hypothetical protein